MEKISRALRQLRSIYCCAQMIHLHSIKVITYLLRRTMGYQRLINDYTEKSAGNVMINQEHCLSQYRAHENPTPDDRFYRVDCYEAGNEGKILQRRLHITS